MILEIIKNLGPWFWLIVLVVCCVIEAFTMALTTIWAAIAAVPMIFIARTGLGLKWQFLIFAILTLALIIITRPFAIKKLKNGRDRTNVNAMIGEEVLLTKSISKFEKGEAKAKNGVIWTAQTADGQEIAQGVTVIVSAVNGNTLTVTNADIEKTGE